MNLFYSVLSVYGDTSISYDKNRVKFSDTMGVYYLKDDGIYDFVGKILEITLMEKSTEVYGFIYDTKIGKRLINDIRGGYGTIKPVFTGIETSKDGIVFIDGMSLEKIDVAVGAKITMIKPIYN